MNLRQIILGKKTSLDTGKVWKSGEVIPRSLWPSRRAKAKAFKYGPAYQWRIIAFSSEGESCRLKLIFNQEKQIFRATLGVVRDGETIPICDYEYHATEPGWHVHAKCEDLAGINAGWSRFGSRRLPDKKSRHRRDAFVFKKMDMTTQSAFNCAVTFFRLDKIEGDSW